MQAQRGKRGKAPEAPLLVHVLDRGMLTWSQMRPQGDVPPSRGGHSVSEPRYCLIHQTDLLAQMVLVGHLIQYHVLDKDLLIGFLKQPRGTSCPLEGGTGSRSVPWIPATV